MTTYVDVRPLSAEAFAPYGDVLEATGVPDKLINQGRCKRYHDRARLDMTDGRVGVSIFSSEAVTLPLALKMVERHPDGSQAFVPMSADPFLVVVALDQGGAPATPLAFLTAPGQAINFHKGTWHGVLTPLSAPGLFAVVDRIGEGPNLEEHWFEQDYIIRG